MFLLFYVVKFIASIALFLPHLKDDPVNQDNPISHKKATNIFQKKRL